jgi:hypothetical protein
MANTKEKWSHPSILLNDTSTSIIFTATIYTRLPPTPNITMVEMAPGSISIGTYNSVRIIAQASFDHSCDCFRLKKGGLQCAQWQGPPWKSRRKREGGGGRGEEDIVGRGRKILIFVIHIHIYITYKAHSPQNKRRRGIWGAGGGGTSKRAAPKKIERIDAIFAVRRGILCGGPGKPCAKRQD